MQLKRTIGLLVASVSIASVGITGCVPLSQSNAQVSQAPTTTQTGRASGKRGIDIIQMKKIAPVLRSNALSTM